MTQIAPPPHCLASTACLSTPPHNRNPPVLSFHGEARGVLLRPIIDRYYRSVKRKVDRGSDGSRVGPAPPCEVARLAQSISDAAGRVSAFLDQP